MKKINLIKRNNKTKSVFGKLFIPTELIIITLGTILCILSYNEQKTTILNKTYETVEILAKHSVKSIDGDKLVEIKNEEDVIKSSYIDVSSMFSLIKQDTNLKYFYTIYEENDEFFYGIDTESSNKSRSFPGTKINYTASTKPNLNVLKKGKIYTNKSITTNKFGETLIVSYAPVFNSKKEFVGAIVCEYDVKNVLDELSNLSMQLIYTAIICIIISSIIITIILLSVLKNINNINNKLINLSSNEGDLSQTLIMSSKDELHDFAGHINNLIKYIKDIVININENSLYINKIVEVASNNIDDIENNLLDSETKTQNINNAVFSISDSILALNKATSEIINTMNATGNQLNDAVNYAMSIKNHAKQATNSAIKRKELAISSINTLSNNLIRKLATSKHINTIDTLASDIISITDETNLLALNASIKAAHAEDNGKGFVVIADEISKLAVTTESSAIQIQNTSKSIITVIKELSNSITNMLDFINEHTEIVFNDLVNTSNIYYANSQQLSSILQDFSNATNEFTDNLNNMQSSIQDVNSIMLNTKERVDDIKLSSNNISNNIKTLTKEIQSSKKTGTNIKEDVSQFKL